MTDPDDSLEAQAIALLEEALEEREPMRREFVTVRAGADNALKTRTLALLDVAAIDDLITGGGAAAAYDAVAPAEIGNYRIEREIGRGGMGAVYLGRRKSGDFDHVAAVKIVRRSAALSERLRAERRLLAGLRHPNIAQLYDGGETPEGAPYFVMEYVDGVPLRTWLEAGPALKDRLAVFKGACEGVAYAHRNLVVHRDLTPANILVNAEGAAKIIDFGISAALGDTGSGAAATKGYAAPERKAGAAATTLADIYSLGVILDAMTATIGAPRAEDLRAIATRARAEAPEDRYQSVEALIADLGRYERQEPVEARGDGALYAFSRFAGRRRWAVTAALAAFAASVIVSVITSLLYVRATAAEREAQAQFQSVRELAKFMLFDLHDEIAKVPGSTRARERLADTGRRYLDALSAAGGADPALRVETALGYKRLGDVAGNAASANLGRRAEAGDLLETAFAQLSGLASERPQDRAVQRAFAETAYSLAVYRFIIDDNSDRAIDAALTAEAAIGALLGGGAAAPADRLLLAQSEILRGKALVWKGEGEEAIALVRQALASIDALHAETPADEAIARARADAAVDLGDTISRHIDTKGGDQAEALGPLDDGVVRFAALVDGGDGDPDLMRRAILSRWKRALVTYAMENDEASLKDLDAATAMIDPLLVRDPDDMGLFRIKLGILSQQALSLRYLGQHAEAVAHAEQNIAGRRRLAGQEPSNVALKRELAGALRVLGEARGEAGDKSGACAAFSEALSLIGADGAGASDYYESGEGKAIRDGAQACA